MARKRRGSHRTDPDAPYELVDDEREETPRRRGRRQTRKKSWLSRILILMLLLAAVVAALPSVITRTPLRNSALAWGGSLLGLKLEAESLSGGWLTKLRAENVVIRDTEGQPLLESADLQLDRNLISLLRNQTDIGVVRLTKPVAHLALRADGNNWNDALAPLLSGESSGKTPRLKLEITDGLVHVQAPRQLESLTIGPLHLNATVDDSQPIPLQCELATTMSNSVGQTGQLKLAVEANDIEFSTGQARIASEHLPLAALQTTLASFTPHLQMSGDMDVDSTLKWSLGSEPRALLRIESLEVSQLRARSSQMPPGDEIRLALLRGTGDVRWEDGKLHADNLQLESDVASVSASGRLNISRMLNPAGPSLTNDDEMDVAAQVDLARAAEMLPTTLRIRSDTKIDSGVVQASLNSNVEQGERIWHGVLTTSQLAATTNGKQFRWDKPVAIEVDASQQSRGWSVRKLNCVSSFLQLKGSGDPDAGKIDLNGDLNRLRTELSQFVDLGDIKMAGQATGYVAWQPSATGPQASGRVDLTQFQLELPGKAPLIEPQLTLQFSGKGRRDLNGQLTHVDQAQMTVQAADDKMAVQLSAPMIYNASDRTFPLRIQISGALSRWLMRTAVLTNQPNLSGDGVVDFDGSIVVSPSQIAISKSTLAATDCKIFGLVVPIDEPRLNADVIGVYDFGARRWIGGNSTIASATFAAGCNNLSIDPSAITGDIGLRGDLARVLRLLKMERDDQRYQGIFSGHVRLVQQQSQTQFVIQQRLENFAVLHLGVEPLRTVSTSPAWRTSWAESFVDLDTAGVYTPSQGALSFERLKVGVDSAQIDVTGNLSDLAGRLNANLSGQLSYNLQRLTKKLEPIVGNSVLLEGVSEKPIVIRGPLRPLPVDPTHVAAANAPLLPMDLFASAGFKWDAAAIEGFRVGPGEINTSLEQATVRFDSMQIPVSQGKVLLAPQISFRTSSPILTVPPGPIVERLSISEEMTHTWMKYVAPMLADTTRVQGDFSASVERVNIPLTNPASGEIKGTLSIHGAQAGPGPLAQQLLGFALQAENLVKNAGTAGGFNFDRALDLLNNGGLVNPQGRLDPQRAIGGLLNGIGGGSTPAAPSTKTVWLTVPAHDVGFHVAQGRVYHEGMRVVVDGIEIRTTGSVGLDETLNLVAEFPIPDRWIGNTPALAPLRGQILKVPVTGSIRRPQLDNRAVTQMVGQLFSGAAAGALGNAGGTLGNVFGQGPAGEGGVPRMLPTNPIIPGAAQPSATTPASPNPSNPGSNPPDLNNTIQNGINNATGNAQREVDRALRKIFNN